MKNAHTPDMKEFAQKYFHIFSYFHPNNRKVAAINLWGNGIRIFHGATIIKQFEAFEKLPCDKTKPPNPDQIMPFMLDNIIDKTRIITCFENFMKGVLMLQGYVAHKLSKKNSTLRNSQNTRPIRISEVFSESSFTPFNLQNTADHETLEQTIMFSTLLTQQYQSVLQIPPDILSVLTKMNEERNKLHFINLTEFQLGKHTIVETRQMINFVSTIMIPQVQLLDKDMQTLKSASPSNHTFTV